MEECEHCKIAKGEHEGKACGDMWLFKDGWGWRLMAPMGESKVFYCPWCGRELENE